MPNKCPLPVKLHLQYNTEDVSSSYHGYAMKEISMNSTSLYETN